MRIMNRSDVITSAGRQINYSLDIFVAAIIRRVYLFAYLDYSQYAANLFICVCPRGIAFQS